MKINDGKSNEVRISFRGNGEGRTYKEGRLGLSSGMLQNSKFKFQPVGVSWA